MFFHGGDADIEAIRKALEAEGFVTTLRPDSMLVIEWRGYDRILYGLFVHDSCASDLALHFVNSDCVQIEYLKVCDTYFAIQFDNLEEILNETDFLKKCSRYSFQQLSVFFTVYGIGRLQVMLQQDRHES